MEKKPEGEDVTEYICEDALTYSGIPANTIDKHQNAVHATCIWKELTQTSNHQAEDRQNMCRES
jgi:hypothetical protein